MDDERRRSPRMRMFKSGKILLGTRGIPCTVRNLSDGGACLEFPSTYGIPPKFELVMADRPTRSCKMVWLAERKVGVCFA
jgi:hypothetical protein